MDYEKLSKKKLAEIMTEIRKMNQNEAYNRSQHRVTMLETTSIIRDAELGGIEYAMQEAAVGTQIGIKKAAMYKKRGISRIVARVIEKVYLRIAELSHRDLRDFCTHVISAVRCISGKLEILFYNDQILEDRIIKTEGSIQSLQREIDRQNLEGKIRNLEKDISELQNDHADKKSQERIHKIEQTVQILQSQLVNVVSKDEICNLEQNIQFLRDKLTELASQDKLCELWETVQNLQVSFENQKESLEEMRAAQYKLSEEMSNNEQLAASIGEVKNHINNAIAEEKSCRDRKAIELVEKYGNVLKRVQEAESLIRNETALLHWSNTSDKGAQRISSRKEHLGELSTQFYHEFEERFRGTQDDIYHRLSAYVPALKEELGDLSSRTFIDIGCGRGEMLDVLRDNGAGSIVGIDTNAIQLTICEQKGHAVYHLDCFEYLKTIEDNSIDCISAIQVIEHFSFDELLLLFRECNRVLKKGGVFLAETPNCENIMTATRYFYIDPTHNRPINPALAAYIAEYSGFGTVRIMPMNEAKYEKKLEQPICLDGNQTIWDMNIELLNHMFYGPQDYAVVGIK